MNQMLFKVWMLNILRSSQAASTGLKRAISVKAVSITTAELIWGGTVRSEHQSSGMSHYLSDACMTAVVLIFHF